MNNLKKTFLRSALLSFLKIIVIIAIAAIIFFSFCGSRVFGQSPEATLGCNFVNLDEFGTIQSMEKIVDATPANGTILCRLRMDKIQSNIRFQVQHSLFLYFYF